MSFEVTGKLHKVFETDQKSTTFKAREFVIEVVDGNYPQFVKFQLTQDRCELIDSYAEGSDIKVHFDLRGREWQGKYFTNLNAWRIEGVQSGGVGGDNSKADQEGSMEASDPFSDEPRAEDFGDLPF